jgi:ABC-type branched-subunit amino acid transport system ATPase component/ABC-type branched-subunit amino acid transport system permease subunit
MNYFLVLLGQVGCYCLIGTGVSLLFGYGGIISLSQAAIASVAALVYGDLTISQDWTPLLAAVAGIFVASLVGLVFALLVSRLSPAAMMVSTLGLQLAYQDFLVSGGKLTGGAEGLIGLPPLSIGSTVLNATPLGFAVLSLGVALVAVVVVIRPVTLGQVGRMLMVAKANRTVLRATGRRDTRLRRDLFLLAAAVSAVGGILLCSNLGLLDPDTLDINVSVSLLLLAFLGGSESPWGGLAGACAIVFIPALLELAPLSDAAVAYASQAAFALIVIIVVFIRPDGLVRRRVPRYFTAVQHGLGEQVHAPHLRAQGDEGDARQPDDETAAGPGLALRTDAATKTFGGIVALDEVSVEFPAREVSAIIGLNGSGKTTLLNVLNGLLPLNSGKVFIGDTDITRSSLLKVAQLGVLRSFQEGSAYRGLAAAEACMLSQRLPPESVLAAVGHLRSSRAERKAAAACVQALSDVGLADKATQRMESLSYGQRKLVDLARLRASNSSVLLLDEPAAGLDPGMLRLITEHIRALAYLGHTVLVVEHNLQFVRALEPSACACLVDGRLIMSGSLDKVLADESVLQSYLGTSIR